MRGACGVCGSGIEVVDGIVTSRDDQELRDHLAEQIARGLTLAAEVDKLTEAIRLTVEEYPGYEEMDRIAAAIGLPGYLEREVTPIQTDP